ncbi:MAG: hypothetical protein WB580_04795 [Candidatus Binataceae bacterium]
MARLSSIPFEKVDPELQAVMREYDVELGGSGFVQVLAHAPESSRTSSNFTFLWSARRVDR